MPNIGSSIIYATVSRGRKELQKEDLFTNTTGDTKISVNKQKNYYKWIIGLAVFVAVTLPFHYVPTALMVFPKDNFTFSYTIITQDDIDKLLVRYNACENTFQQQSIRNEPLFRKLSDKGLIYDENSNTMD